MQGREKQITKEDKVLQPLPHKDFRFANPFIALHHMLPEHIQPGSELRIHPHPHRGMVQLWINVPAAHKWDEPTYQSATRQQLPNVLEQEAVNLRLASGEYDGKTGPIKSLTPVVTITGEMQKGSRVQFTATPGYWTLLYVTKGNINVNMETISKHSLIVFEKENEEIMVCAEEDAHILFLSAAPIDEHVAVKDNFVMNTKEEIEQAIADYKNGVFGSLRY